MVHKISGYLTKADLFLQKQVFWKNVTIGEALARKYFALFQMQRAWQ